jgi:AraC family transcriptional regulator
MNADVHILYQSSFYRIFDFCCKCDKCSQSEKEYSENFTISYIRNGNFIFNVFRNNLDAYNGNFLVGKPGHEHLVSHYDNSPDRCTIFNFDKSFYELMKNEFSTSNPWFFNNNDIQSLLVKATAETEYLHASILKALRFNTFSGLLIDALVVETANKIMEHVGINNTITFPASVKKYHLKGIENAKEYILENFDKDISVFDIAQKAFVSPFHFSRMFKTFTGISPHHYLMDTRLKNADILLKNTNMPVTQVCFESGFNNAEHFSYAYKKKFKIKPSLVKKQFK